MITRVKIENFKSLKDVEVHLKDFNVLVGLNASGKSNFLEVLELTRLFQEVGTDIITQRGGFRSFVYGGDIGNTIRVELEGNSPSQPEVNLLYAYSITGGPAQYIWSEENLDVIEGSKRRPVFSWNGNQANTYKSDGTETGNSISGGFSSRPVLSSWGESSDWGNQMWPLAREFVDAIHFFSLIPQKMNQPNPARKIKELSSSGEQLSAVMHMIQSEQPEVFADIVRVLKAALPELQDVRTGLTETGETYITFVEKGLGAPVSVWALSDGIRHLMGVLLAEAMTPKGGTLCLEEPENFVHQGWLDLIFDVLESAREDKQIILTTHSSYLLDKVDPANLMLCEKRDGRTEIRSYTKERLREVREALESLPLGELYTKGYLEPAE